MADEFPRVAALPDPLTDDYDADVEFGLDLLISASNSLQAGGK